jgi:hypothetical protein
MDGSRLSNSGISSSSPHDPGITAPVTATAVVVRLR